MPYYKHVIFDLDGTLTNSKTGIINAAIYAYNKMGIRNPPIEKLNKQIGIPLQDYLRIDNHITSSQLDVAVKHFRIYYGEKGAYENEPYPGVMKLIKNLYDLGVNIYISTAKYEKYALVIADYFKFTPLIKDLVGADAGGLHATKTELTSKIISRNKINDLKHTVMVGDKYMDIQAGKNTNIDTIGVTYGFGSIDELVNEKPTYIVNSVEELYAFLIH
ncbi:HAD hydrolase-like protein [Bacteroidota bacterium]